jgi:hypothetical protein
MSGPATRPRSGLAVAGLIAIWCGVCSLVHADAPVSPPLGESLRAKALELVAHERYQEAHDLCVLAMKAHPKDALLAYLMGRIHEPWKREVRMMINAPTEAEPQATPSERVSGSHREYAYDQAHVMMAATGYETAVELAPDDMEYRAALCRFWVDAGNNARVRVLLEWLRANRSRPGVPGLPRDVPVRASRGRPRHPGRVPPAEPPRAAPAGGCARPVGPTRAGRRDPLQASRREPGRP